MKPLELFLFLLCFFVLNGLVLRYLLLSAFKIHEKLDLLKQKVKNANTSEELSILYEELKKINKESWHKSFTPRIVEIKAIIDTKFKILTLQ